MKIIKIDPEKPELSKLQAAANLILDDGIIGYPTETIYGLGVNAFSDVGVEKVFQLKEREKGKPILIISYDIQQVKSLVISFPEQAEKLAQAFWPGALTMVLEASPHLSRLLLGGGNYIGIRIPDNKICLELIKLCGVPITSSSANISGYKNPISAQEVFENFGEKLDLIIDGGKARSRIPSTVVAVEEKSVKLIREGAITMDKVKKVIGNFINERQR